MSTREPVRLPKEVTDLVQLALAFRGIMPTDYKASPYLYKCIYKIGKNVITVTPGLWYPLTHPTSLN